MSPTAAGSERFPVHSWMFKGMLTRIARAAQAQEKSGEALPRPATGLDHA